jgi:flavin-dependent dehydrogenase
MSPPEGPITARTVNAAAFAFLRERWSVVVIGAGPAGAAAAIELARRGVDVLLVERKVLPRFKVCGGCLNVRALRALDELGVLPAVRAAGGTPLGTLRWAIPGRHVDIRLPGGIALSRETLDDLLVRRAVECGAVLLSETTAEVLPDCDGGERGVRLHTSHAEVRLRAALVIVAAGLHGRRSDAQHHVDPASYVGVGCVCRDEDRYPQGTVCMAVGRAGYVGIARAEDARLCVAAALSPDALRSRPSEQLCRDVIREAGFPDLPEERGSDWHGTVALTQRRQPPSATRVLYVGDAAGYVEPFTGEGIGWALSGGRLAAEFAVQGVACWTQTLAAEWNRAYRRFIGRPQRLCWWLTGLLRRPRLLRTTLRAVGVCPGLATPFVRRLSGGPLP